MCSRLRRRACRQATSTRWSHCSIPIAPTSMSTPPTSRQARFAARFAIAIGRTKATSRCTGHSHSAANSAPRVAHGRNALWPSRSRLPLLRWRSIIEGNDMKKALIAIIIGVGIAAPLAATRDLPAPAPSAAELRPAWTEYKWPFPVDQWGIGRAFVCMPGECGVEVNLYLRPKIGFCRDATGVDDDDELERIGDAGLLDTRAAPSRAGHAVEVAWMNGRIRPYGVSGSAQE